MNNELSEKLSNCCDAPIYEDTDICSDCKDHCSDNLASLDYEPDYMLLAKDEQFN